MPFVCLDLPVLLEEQLWLFWWLERKKDESADSKWLRAKGLELER